LVAAEGPRKSNPRREVVFVRLETATRDAIRADRHEITRHRVVDRCAILRVNWRRVVFVTQTRVQRQPRSNSIAVVNEKVVTLRANLLRVIYARDARQQREAEQQISKCVPRKLKEWRELKPPARFNIAKRVLLREAQVGAELDQVIAVNVTRVVQKLVNVRHAILRVVAFVAERREAGDRDETESEVACARRDRRQANLRVKHASFLCY